jgi:hypothetical protein
VPPEQQSGIVPEPPRLTNTIINSAVTSEAALNNAIIAADSETIAGTYTIDITGSIAETAALEAINLHTGVTLVINGGGETLNGEGDQRGLFVYAGIVDIDNLTIADTEAVGGGGGGVGGGSGSDGGGGFGGGGGGSSSGGGVGAGGDIFVQQGASLIIEGGSLATGIVAGGTGYVAGDAYGSGIFLQGDQSVTLAAAAGQTIRIAGVITDQTGSSGTLSNAGAGSVLIGDLSGTNTGIVAFTTTDTYVGGTTIVSGTLDLAHAGAAGSGATQFGTATGLVLQIGHGDTPRPSTRLPPAARLLPVFPSMSPTHPARPPVPPPR